MQGEPDEDDRPPPRPKRAPLRLSPAVLVALIFGGCTALALAVIGTFADVFSNEFGVDRWVFVVVPALFGALFALMIYHGADRKIKTIRESLSRAMLVALVTWIVVSGLSTFAWCLPWQYGACFSKALLVTGLVGGGPLLLATLIAGAVGGFVLLRRTPQFRKIDSGP